MNATTQQVDNPVFTPFVQLTLEGKQRVEILVDGVHCAGCIQRVEEALRGEASVTHVRLNFSTRRLVVEWDGAADLAELWGEKIADLGYGVQPFDPAIIETDSAREGKDLLLCLGVAGFAMGNIMMLSVGVWVSTAEEMGVATRDFLHWFSALIGLPTIAYSGRPFFRSAFRVLSTGHTNMDVPISIALILTGGMSVFELLHHGEHVYFDSAVMLMFFLLIGRVLDFRARRSARGAATGLLSLISGSALVRDEATDEVKALPIRELKENMLVQVGVGAHVPADGTVETGRSDIDTSLVTGESIPRSVEAGAHVYGGTLNMSAPLQVRITRQAEDSLLADIVRLMEKAEQGQARYVRLADRAAKLYTPVVHSLAAIAFFGWLFLGSIVWQDALLIAVSVLIITCPCALGLAVPVVQVLAIGRLMKRNILVKAGDALERLAGIDTIIFDKTGTLTLGRPVLQNADQYEGEVLKLAVSLAVQSVHPLSKALRQSYDGPVIELDVTEHPGQGLEAQYEGQTIRLGARNWCGDENAPARHDALELWLDTGAQKTLFTFEDTARSDAPEILKALQAEGLELHLLSGDRDGAAQHVAENLGIAHVEGDLSPADKFARLEELRAAGHKVLMVGDGLNDTPVLAGADVSMAPSSAIDMAQNSADIIFMGEDLAPVLEALRVARLSQKLVKGNFALAVMYNIIAIPLGMAGFVTPMVAALAMSGSSLVVIANSFRLRLAS